MVRRLRLPSLSTCHIQLCLLERQASSHFKCSLQSVINPLTQLRRSSCGPNSSFVIPAIEGLLACMLCPLLMCVDNCLWRTCHIAKVCRTGSSCSQTSLSPPSIRTQSLATTEEKKKRKKNHNSASPSNQTTCYQSIHIAAMKPYEHLQVVGLILPLQGHLVDSIWD